MSLSAELIVNAQRIRSKLRSPENAVADHGIDLKRLPKGFHLQMDRYPLIPKPRIIFIVPPAIEPEMSKPPTIRSIQTAVALHYGVSVADILGTGRHMPLVRYRQVAVYLCREILPQFNPGTHQTRLYSYPRLGRSFGGRDHSTAISAYRKIVALMASDPVFAAQVNSLKSEIIS